MKKIRGKKHSSIDLGIVLESRDLGYTVKGMFNKSKLSFPFMRYMSYILTKRHLSIFEIEEICKNIFNKSIEDALIFHILKGEDKFSYASYISLSEKDKKEIRKRIEELYYANISDMKGMFSNCKTLNIKDLLNSSAEIQNIKQ